MKRNFVKLILMTASAMFMFPAMAQDSPELSMGTDIVSRYIWRGQKLGDVSLQPTLGVSYKGLSLTAWGSVGLSESKDTKEFDLTLAYTVGGFNVGITDYWFDSAGDKYFVYGAHSTAHTFEANIGYDFGVVNFQWYTNFAGSDGVTRHNHRAYSSYAEVSAPFKAVGCDWSATVGCVPYGTSFYSEAPNRFGVTNLALKATKELVLSSKFAPSVFASVVANPSSQAAYFVCGITVTP